jgi:hypothetical protein
MLKYFFEKAQESCQHLFHSLKIWQAGEIYRREQSQYPVLFLTFKDIKASSFFKAYAQFQIEMSKLYACKYAL